MVVDFKNKTNKHKYHPWRAVCQTTHDTAKGLHILFISLPVQKISESLNHYIYTHIVFRRLFPIPSRRSKIVATTRRMEHARRAQIFLLQIFRFRAPERAPRYIFDFILYFIDSMFLIFLSSQTMQKMFFQNE